LSKIWGWLKDMHWIGRVSIILIGLYLIFGLFINALGIGPGIVPFQNSPAKSNQGYDVEYIVDGTVEKAVITYTNEKGWTTEKLEVDVPWRWTSASKFPKDTSIYISAQGKGIGSIRVQVNVDGALWKESEDFGPYVLVSAIGYAGDE